MGEAWAEVECRQGCLRKPSTGWEQVRAGVWGPPSRSGGCLPLAVVSAWVKVVGESALGSEVFRRGD